MMERRIRILEGAFAPPASVQMRAMAEFAAAETGLDPVLVLVEAEAVLQRMQTRGRWSLVDLAADEGVDPDDLVRWTTELHDRWEAIR